MLNFEEELAKFKPIPEVSEAAEMISDEPLVDISDILKKILEESTSGK